MEEESEVGEYYWYYPFLDAASILSSRYWEPNREDDGLFCCYYSCVDYYDDPDDPDDPGDPNPVVDGCYYFC